MDVDNKELLLETLEGKFFYGSREHRKTDWSHIKNGFMQFRYASKEKLNFLIEIIH